MKYQHNATKDEARILMEAFGNVAKVQIHERDDVHDYQRFKYAAGRNYETCLAVVRGTEALIQQTVGVPSTRNSTGTTTSNRFTISH